MWNKPSTTRLQKIPGLYTTESTSLQDKLIYLHFFIGGCDWYVAESDGYDTCWGYAVLNADDQNGEWGYFSLSELEQINIYGIEVDCELEESWKLKPARLIDTISRTHHWDEPVYKAQYDLEA